MTELEEIFAERDELYYDYTKALFEVLNDTALTATYEVMNLNPDNVMWQDVQLFDDVVLLVAFVTYKPNDVIVAENGEKITLDETTAELYQRIIRIGLPVKLAATGTKEEIMKFLRESNKQTQDKEISLGDTPDTIDGFSKDNLTEEQIKQLQLLQTYNAGGKSH